MKGFITENLPKVGTFLLTGLSAGFMYFHYSMLQLFQMHQHSMLSEDYQTRFNAAPCSHSNSPSRCFWEKMQNTSPHVLSNFSADMFGTLPWIGLAGGATVTFVFHYGDKIRDKAYNGISALTDTLFPCAPPAETTQRRRS